jgi:hypothetical protein
MRKMNEFEPGEMASFEHERAQIQQMSAWLDEAVMLGAQLEHTQAPASDVPASDLDFEETVSELNMSLPRGLRLQFEGPGYTCRLDEEGIPITIYRDEQRPVVGSGELTGIKILDDTEVEYVCEDCETGLVYDDDEIDEETFSNTAAVEACTHPEPSDLPQVFLEFETARIDSRTDDLSLYGECIRTDKLRFYSLLVASSVQVELITPVSEAEQCEREDVIDVMQSAATRMRRLVRDTAFRRSTIEQQQQQMETLLDETNQHLGLERFETFAAFDSFYQKGLDEAELVFVESADGHRYFNPCVIKPLRLGSLDLENQPNKAIRSNKDLLSTETSLYMVAEVDEFVQRQIGADSQIIWIPIAPKQGKARRKKFRQSAEEIDLEFHPASIDLSADELY